VKSKIVGILLSFCFAAPVATTFVMLHYQKKQVKREIKRKIIAGIDKEELVLLKFTEVEKQTELNWKHAREFEFRGSMYDIVETEFHGDTTYYWCWWDYEETQLNKQLDELVTIDLGNNPENDENQKRLHTFFKSLYCSETDQKETFVFRELKCKYFSSPDLYRTLIHFPPVPPPEIG
jgi:hypothetical protein